MLMNRIRRWTLLALASLASMATTPALANSSEFETEFDRALGTQARAPKAFAPSYASELERLVALSAEGSRGRIGVAALDLNTGQSVSILGEQRFPMASTSKIAIAATFLEGVDRGRWSLDASYPLLMPMRSQPFSTRVAPVQAGQAMNARQLINIMIARSSNPATDALLRVVGGPQAVNDWAKRAGIKDFRLDRDIATLVRDDGEFDPAVHIDERDSTTPNAMVEMVSGLYQGRWLSQQSRDVLIGAMERTVTGKRRIPALLPENVTVAHKTGSLNNTSSDVGIIRLPDGRTIALAIYATGQGSRLAREQRIASIARTIHDGVIITSPHRISSAR